MSTLTTIEKRYFEELLGMDSGYVLDFSNDSFDELFRTNFNIDIYDDKYSIKGGSKAKRLRAFWELEPDPLVGRVLSEMLKIAEYNKHREGITKPDPTFDKCKSIVERLIDMPKRVISQAAESRIWGEEGYRVFLSHKATVKQKATSLKETLSLFGIAAFVAHKDVKPTKKWQEEIENALFSMDALVALMTKDFHESYWTDQEIGVAFGRENPIISVKLGQDPYGFIGKFQALSCSWDEAPIKIAKLLMEHDKMITAYINAVNDCHDFDHGNILAELLPHIEKLSVKQTEDLIKAFNDNLQVRGSFGFNGAKPSRFGKGLIYHLKRITKQEYRENRRGDIELV